MKNFATSLLAATLGAGIAQAQITSTFDTTNEGWFRSEYNQGNFTFSAPVSINFTSARGNPPGAITIADGPGTYFTFWSSPTYIGNQSAFAGGEIVVDKSSNGSASLVTNPYAFTIALRSTSGTFIGYKMPRPAHSAWTTFRAPLIGSLGWVHIATSLPVSDAEFNAVLADLNAVALMGDYKSGSDSTDVDNMYIGPQVAPVALTTFDADALGWTLVSLNLQGNIVLRPTAPGYSLTAGNPGGGLQAGDPDANSTFALAPRSFGGDFTPYANGEMSFDLQNVKVGTGSGSNAFPAVVLQQAAKRMYYTIPSTDGFLPLTFTKFLIPMYTTPNWHMGEVDGPQPTEAEFAELLRYLDTVMIRMEYVNGNETDTLDNVAVTGAGGTTGVSGYVDLGAAYSGSPEGVEVRLGVFKGGWPMGEYGATLDASGNYFATIPTSGNVSFMLKGSHWLRSARSGTQVANGTPLTQDFALVNGDVDDDNTVSLFDYIILSEAFDSEVGGATYDARADLDGDGVVSVFDYLILSEAFDASGSVFG